MSSFDYDLINDFKKNRYTISLNNRFNYTTKFNIQSVPVVLTCGYNTRNKLRWITLSNTSGEILLPQTFIKFNKRCELNLNAEQSNLQYFLTLKRKDKNKKDFSNYDYSFWANDFDLLFDGYPQEIEERLNNNYRVVFVGN